MADMYCITWNVRRSCCRIYEVERGRTYMHNHAIFSTTIKNARAARLNCHLVSTVTVLCKVLRINCSVIQNGRVPHLHPRTHDYFIWISLRKHCNLMNTREVRNTELLRYARNSKSKQKKRTSCEPGLPRIWTIDTQIKMSSMKYMLISVFWGVEYSRFHKFSVAYLIAPAVRFFQFPF